MDTSKLRDDTRAVWERLDGHPLLKGFVLIGGTALTLRIGHRISEDLDFAFLGGRHLPSRRLATLVNGLRTTGVNMVLDQSPRDEEEFLDSGLVLANYQQNYIANNVVRVTFVVLDGPVVQALQGSADDRLRVATLDEIFATKCLVCADRSKTRDWFDLYVLMTKHGFSQDDFYNVFARYNALNKFEIASMRLRAGKPDLGDEGYEHLLPDGPGLDDMRAFFSTQLDELQVRLATEAFREDDA